MFLVNNLERLVLANVGVGKSNSLFAKSVGAWVDQPPQKVDLGATGLTNARELQSTYRFLKDSLMNVLDLSK